jgi:uncharacterized protein with HEPN domain
VLYLGDILRAIDLIERDVAKGEATFQADDHIQRWIAAQIQDIGEAAAHLPPEWLAEHPDIPWSEIVGMRNRIAHGYFAIRLDVVWESATIGTAKLKRAVLAILAAREG